MPALWQWMSQNSQVLSMLANLGMLVVWMLYLHLFLLGYRRQRRCNILINIGGHESPEARCLIANMSAEPIYITAIIATLSAGDETWSRSMTDYELRDAAHPPGDPVRLTRQGPLRSGDYRDVGSFAELIGRAREAHDDPPPGREGPRRPDELRLTVIAVYNAEELLVGADRSFVLPAEEHAARVRPKTPQTRQIRSRRARRRLVQQLRDYL